MPCSSKPREKSEEFRLGVRGVSVFHRRAGVAQAPARRKRRSARKGGVTGHHLAHLPAEHDIEIEIAVARFETPVRAMIGVDFLAEIEGAPRKIIVEKPHDWRAARRAGR